MIAQEIAAGREMDALIAEKVMGWRRDGKDWWTSPAHRDGFTDWEDKGEHDLLESPDGVRVWFCGCHRETLEYLPAYSTDIAVAWLVVGKMLDSGYSFAVWDVPMFSSVQPGPIVAFKRSVHPPKYEDTNGYGETVPLAICRAALKAIG